MNRRRALASLASAAGGVVLAAGVGRADEPKPPVPGAVPFSPGGEVKIGVRSSPVKVNDADLSLIYIGGGAFQLDGESRLTAVLEAGVAQYAKVEYQISAAVFDAAGRLLGTAGHKEAVEYIREGRWPTVAPRDRAGLRRLEGVQGRRVRGRRDQRPRRAQAGLTRRTTRRSRAGRPAACPGSEAPPPALNPPAGLAPHAPPGYTPSQVPAGEGNMQREQMTARIERLEALERGLAKEIATHRGGPWFMEAALQQRDYVSAILEPKMALAKARDALTKAAAGGPSAGLHREEVEEAHPLCLCGRVG